MKKVERTLRNSAVVIAELIVCGTIVSLLRSGDTERLLLAFGTLLFVLIPEILERLLRCKINIVVYLIAVLYAMGSMMGHCWKFYYTIPCWDKLLHLCGGVMFVILGIYLFERLSCGKANHISAVVFALCFSLAISVLWEFVEYGADLFLGMDMQDDTVVSGITSYLLGAEKGMTGSIDSIRSVTVNGVPLPVDGYIDVGLHDTMLDMLLESLGAMITCVLVFLDKGKHPLIQTQKTNHTTTGSES